MLLGILCLLLLLVGGTAAVNERTIVGKLVLMAEDHFDTKQVRTELVVPLAQDMDCAL
jgi:hypothetical protein